MAADPVGTHTPTPWHVGPHYKSDIESRFGRIAECGVTRGPQAEANAAFIVRACNAHAELLAALKRIQALDLKKDERGRDDFYSGPDRFFQAWNIANDALRHAEGSSPRTQEPGGGA